MMGIRIFNLIPIILLVLLGSCKEVSSQQDAPSFQATQGESQEAQKEKITVIDVDVFQSQLQLDDTQLIDVRTDAEWERGHLKNAKHFEINNPQWDVQINTLDKNKPVYVYCAKGGRSARCARQLEEAGFTEIYDLKGGISEWQAQGNTVE